jgi:long-chain acyl-CoA synthetase
MNMVTIPKLFLDRATTDPNTISAWALTPSTDDQFFLAELKHDAPEGPEGWSCATYGEIHHHVAGLARRLHSFGIGRGSVVAILAQTSERWAITDMAIQCLGGITVGIYPTLLPLQVRYQLEHSEAALLIVEDEAQATRCLSFTEELTSMRHVLSLHPAKSVTQLTPAMPDIEWLAEQIDAVRLEDVATYIYTSGTTGTPKAVVLNHHNFTSIIAATRERLPLLSGDRTVIFLPMAHVLQRFTQYRGLTDDAIGWFAPSIEALPETIRIARPHVLATVPRMLEKIRSKIRAQAAQKSPRALGVLDWAIQVGRMVNDMRWDDHRIGWRLQAQHRIADRLVFSKIRAGLGGHLRLLISGGAALDPELATWFEAIGISVREGWGLSETTAPAAANGTENFRFGTVGTPLLGTEIILADDGELLVRGPGVFQCYLKDEAATAEVFTEEGFFKTGDLGVIHEGFIQIVGRKKEIIVTAGGKNIAPIPIEQALEGGIIGQAVVGDDRPYLTALLAPDTEVLEARAQAGAWSGTLSEWVRRPDVVGEIEDQLVHTNSLLARFETIKKWAILDESLTEQNGLLTPTLKRKRSVIQQRFAQQIEELYT